MAVKSSQQKDENNLLRGLGLSSWSVWSLIFALASLTAAIAVFLKVELTSVRQRLFTLIVSVAAALIAALLKIVELRRRKPSDG